jgi:enoyl-CoA hydratase/carnithine racemase
VQRIVQIESRDGIAAMSQCDPARRNAPGLEMFDALGEALGAAAAGRDPAA